MALRSVHSISKHLPLLLVFTHLFFLLSSDQFIFKEDFSFITGYFTHIFPLFKIPHNLNQISGNQHWTQILSLGDLEFFSGSHYQLLALSISVLKWSVESRNVAYFQLCLSPLYTDNSQAAVRVIVEMLAGSLQVQSGGVPESIQSA